MNQAVSRRNFLKKAAYAAPVVLALGAMTAPISAHASVIFTRQIFDEGTTDQVEFGQNFDNVNKAIEDGYLSYDFDLKTYKTTDKFSKLDFKEDALRNTFNAIFRNPKV